MTLMSLNDEDGFQIDPDASSDHLRAFLGQHQLCSHYTHGSSEETGIENNVNMQKKHFLPLESGIIVSIVMKCS